MHSAQKHIAQMIVLVIVLVGWGYRMKSDETE